MPLLVDTSVLIDNFRQVETPSVLYLKRVRRAERILLADLVLMEVLQGAADMAHANRLAEQLATLTHVNVVEDGIAVEAAEHFRTLRSEGISIRSQIDLLIGTYCIRHGHILLHSDRDYDLMAKHLPLRTVAAPLH